MNLDEYFWAIEHEYQRRGLTQTEAQNFIDMFSHCFETAWRWKKTAHAAVEYINLTRPDYAV